MNLMNLTRAAPVGDDWFPVKFDFSADDVSSFWCLGTDLGTQLCLNDDSAFGSRIFMASGRKIDLHVALRHREGYSPLL